MFKTKDVSLAANSEIEPNFLPQTDASFQGLLQGLLQKIDELEKQVAEQAQLKTKLSDLENRLAEQNSLTPIPAKTEGMLDKSRTTSRRKLLKGLGFTAAGLAAASAAVLTQESSQTAQAASGDFTVLGNSNITSNTTYLTQTGGVNNLDKGAVLLADWNPDTQTSLPSPAVNSAIAGVANKGSGSVTGVGGYFKGDRAPIMLEPMSTPGGSHSIGELYVDTNGDLYIYQSTGWVKVNSGSSGTPIPQNFIINGHFAIWQRNTTFISPASLAYNADRWQIQFDGGQAFKIEQKPFALGGTAGDPPILEAEPQFYARVTQTTQGSGATTSNFRQSIEDVRILAGRTATLTYWARTDTGTRTVTTEITQNYGTGGSGSNTLTTQSASIGTSWTKVTQTFSFASLSGATLGTSHFTGIKFKLPLMMTANSYLEFANVQLEVGSVSTPYRYEPFYEVLRRCQRYYQTSFPYGTVPGDNVTSSGQRLYALPNSATVNNHYFTIQFIVPMRIAPTITVYNPSSTGAGKIHNYNRTNASGTTASQATMTGETYSGQVQTTSGTSWAVGDLVSFQFVADAEL